MHFPIPLAELSGEGNDFRHDHLGDASRISEGGIEYRDAFGLGRIQFDLIRSDAETSDRQESPCFLQRLVRDLGFASDPKNMDVPQFFFELLGIERASEGLHLISFAGEHVFREWMDIFQ